MYSYSTQGTSMVNQVIESLESMETMRWDVLTIHCWAQRVSREEKINVPCSMQNAKRLAMWWGDPPPVGK